MKTELITVQEALSSNLMFNETAAVYDINGIKIGMFKNIDKNGNCEFTTSSGDISKSHIGYTFFKRHIN